MLNHRFIFLNVHQKCLSLSKQTCGAHPLCITSVNSLKTFHLSASNSLYKIPPPSPSTPRRWTSSSSPLSPAAADGSNCMSQDLVLFLISVWLNKPFQDNFWPQRFCLTALMQSSLFGAFILKQISQKQLLPVYILLA